MKEIELLDEGTGSTKSRVTSHQITYHDYCSEKVVLGIRKKASRLRAPPLMFNLPGYCWLTVPFPLKLRRTKPSNQLAYSTERNLET